MVDDIDEDTQMRNEENSSDDDSNSNSEQNGGEGDVEWMVTSRQKRSTAGNRLNALLQQEEPDDELELLFATDDENEEDHGFVDVEADSDVQMDSSDDDDDQGPAAGADDFEGEKELQRKEKAERLAKKRKNNDGMPKIFKKRVKIDPTIPSKPAPRPKKKSERASWIPTPEDAPTRASARGTTKKSKEQLHAQMIDREKKRLKQLANMEKAAAAKEAARKPAMTQEDRLVEAARVEKSNSKSLSRWEEAEQQREEEQRLKLAALHNRKLEGPVITWWSGRAMWVGGKLVALGPKKLKPDEPKEKSKKRKAGEIEDENESTESPALKGIATPSSNMIVSPISNEKDSTPVIASGITNGNANKDGTSSRQEPISTISDGILHPPHPELQQNSVLKPPQPPTIPPPTGILQPPNQTSGAVPNISGLQPPHQTTGAVPHINGPLQPPQSHNHAVPFIPLQAPTAVPPFFLQPPSLEGSKPLPGFQPPNTNYPRLIPSQTTPFSFAPSQPQHYSPYSSVPPPPPPPQPPITEYSLRNCLILSNFNEDEIKSKDVQTRILFNQTFPKAPTKSKNPASKSHPSTLCAITHYPAKFRDPKTGLPYVNSYAYKEIQKLRKGEYRWSKLLGAYVGNAMVAARGVPGRFLGLRGEKDGEKDGGRGVGSGAGMGAGVMATPTQSVSMVGGAKGN